MTDGDHRTLPAAGAVALGLSLVPGVYLAPALAGALRFMRPPLGIADSTLDGRGCALTFDDGPHAQGTPAVLEVLQRRETKAIFFLVGEQVARMPSLAAEIVAAGHGVGLHCDRHRNLMRVGPAAVREDMLRAAARIEETTGVPITRYRPPYGIFNAAALSIARRSGWRSLLWTRWGRDWEARASAESIVRRAVGGGVEQGTVLLLHDADHYSAPGSWRRTVAAPPRVLDGLAGSGLEPTLEA